MGTAFTLNGTVVTASHVLGEQTRTDVTVMPHDQAVPYFESDCRFLPTGEIVTIGDNTGIVLGRGEYYEGRESIVADVKAYPGQSGSPVFDENGVVVGVLTDRMGEWAVFTSVCEIE